MSKYETLDDAPLTEFSVHRVIANRKRNDGTRAVNTATEVARGYSRKVSPAEAPLPVTLKWIARLPRQVRPLNLLGQFPRVANALATSWTEREAFQTVLYDLLVDKRGNRNGFPSKVVQELLALRSYFEDSR